MMLILDTSMALSWFLSRSNPNEAIISQEALQTTILRGALVPQLWLWEVTNGLLIAERHGGLIAQDTAGFQADLDSLPISLDTAPPQSLQKRILSLARTSGLTTYDATYLDLALRTSSTLATFDQKLAAAARSAGIPVFGDPS